MPAMPELRAKDVMSRDVVSVSPTLDICSAARLLTEKRISGAPVVDPRGALMGIVSQSDLARFQGKPSTVGLWESEPKSRDDSPASVPVISVMSPAPVQCDEETLVEDVARLMLERRIHRVLVTKDGALTGIVSSLDLLRAIPGVGPRKT